MEFLKNKGCLAEIIIAALLVLGIGYRLLSGNTKAQEMQRAREAGTIEAYQAIIDKYTGTDNGREAVDSVVSIYSRGEYSIQDLLNASEQYSHKGAYYSLANGIKDLAERRIADRYNQASKLNTHEGWVAYCNSVPREYWKDAQAKIVALSPAYQAAERANSIAGWQRYINSAKQDQLGDAQQRLAHLCEEEYKKAKSIGTPDAWRSFKQKVPAEYWQDADKQIEDAMMEYYKTNQLRTGAKPWAKYYGSGSEGGAAVRVNASSSSDVVVVVKYNNSNGRVVNHAYIRKGGSYTLSLPSGNRYQVFFYNGNGWYPDKQMNETVKGGFLSGSWSKDGTPYVLDYGEIMTYTLTATVGGNFSTSGSNANEGL